MFPDFPLLCPGSLQCHSVLLRLFKETHCDCSYPRRTWSSHSGACSHLTSRTPPPSDAPGALRPLPLRCARRAPASAPLHFLPPGCTVLALAQRASLLTAHPVWVSASVFHERGSSNSQTETTCVYPHCVTLCPPTCLSYRLLTT